MATFQAFNQGLDEWRNFTTDTVRCLLTKGTGYTFNPDTDFVAGITPGTNEATAAGYARQTLGTKTRTVNDTNNRIDYTAATINFGSLTTGQTINGAIIYKFVTNDADSILLAYLLIDGRDTAATNPFSIALPDGLCSIAD